MGVFASPKESESSVKKCQQIGPCEACKFLKLYLELFIYKNAVNFGYHMACHLASLTLYKLGMYYS